MKYTATTMHTCTIAEALVVLSSIDAIVSTEVIKEDMYVKDVLIT